jgi:hypothetical protein
MRVLCCRVLHVRKFTRGWLANYVSEEIGKLGSLSALPRCCTASLPSTKCFKFLVSMDDYGVHSFEFYRSQERLLSISDFGLQVKLLLEIDAKAMCLSVAPSKNRHGKFQATTLGVGHQRIRGQSCNYGIQFSAVSQAI